MILGSRENPCQNNNDIAEIIKEIQNCNIYTTNTFEISKENLEIAHKRNIKFVGEAVAYFEILILKDERLERLQEDIEECLSTAEKSLKVKYWGRF